MSDLTGKQFGRWTVLKRAENSSYGMPRWLCRCSCGTERVVEGRRLCYGQSQSCGCLQREIVAATSRVNEAGWKRYYGEIKNRAPRRGLAFELTLEQVKDICSQPCTYCGAKPSQVKTSHHGYDPVTVNGIDRVDNSKGYILGNVVPCCWICNKAKNDMSVGEFRAWAKRLYDHFVA